MAGNREAGQALLVAQIFGRGVSGAAVQNLNLMLVLDPAADWTRGWWRQLGVDHRYLPFFGCGAAGNSPIA
jgi:hypothetical protein